MKNIFTTVAMWFLTIALFAQLPSKTEVVNSMIAVNNYWISQNVSPGNNQWARAVYFTGNMDFARIYPKDSYVSYNTLWATNNGWSLNGGSLTRNADNQTCGQVYFDLYKTDTLNQYYKINAIKTSIDNMVNSPVSNDWSWVDAMYMSMPVFAKMGAYYKDDRYFQKMYELYTDTKVTRGLFNVNEGLWYRDGGYKPPYQTRNGQDCYWSRGNGWVFAAHVRVLQQLPLDNVNRAEYVETFRQMAAALKDRQRMDGFWNASLDDPDEYTGPETSGTSFFTYGMAWGINNGLLDSATYYPVVVKAWSGLSTVAVQPNGFLGYVQGVGAAPAATSVSATADFGVGGFLMAGTEVVKLAKGIVPEPALLNLKSVKVVDSTHVVVAFNKKVNPATALLAANYTISNGVKVVSVAAAASDSATLLRVTGMGFGSYKLQASGVYSTDGFPVEPTDVLSFSYTAITSITASGFESGTANTADKAMDFDLNTRWSCNGKGAWILFDLGDVRTVNSIDVAYYLGNARKGIFSINLSENGTDYTEVFNGQTSGTTLSLENYDFPDLNARYVKIIGGGNTQSTWNSITEVRINTSGATGIAKPMADKCAMAIYPNPFRGGQLNVKSALLKNTVTKLTISDLSGKVLFDQNQTTEGNTLRVNNLRLHKGTYLLQLKNGSLNQNSLLVVD